MAKSSVLHLEKRYRYPPIIATVVNLLYFILYPQQVKQYGTAPQHQIKQLGTGTAPQHIKQLGTAPQQVKQLGTAPQQVKQLGTALQQLNKLSS